MSSKGYRSVNRNELRALVIILILLEGLTVFAQVAREAPVRFINGVVYDFTPALEEKDPYLFGNNIVFGDVIKRSEEGLIIQRRFTLHHIPRDEWMFLEARRRTIEGIARNGPITSRQYLAIEPPQLQYYFNPFTGEPYPKLLGELRRPEVVLVVNCPAPRTWRDFNCFAIPSGFAWHTDETGKRVRINRFDCGIPVTNSLAATQSVVLVTSSGTAEFKGARNARANTRYSPPAPLSNTGGQTELDAYYSRQTQAAEAGNPTDQYNLGIRYLKGIHVETNEELALKWIRAAATNTNKEFRLSSTLRREVQETLESVEARTVSPSKTNRPLAVGTSTADVAQKLQANREAAEQGDPAGQYNLGQMYREGLGVRQDDVEAAKWYRKAAEQGVASAENNLAIMYLKGKGVLQDKLEAAKWFRKAAEQGHPEAQFMLGQMYYFGDGLGQEYQNAKVWFEKAAAQGDPRAEFNLGVMYAEGQGVKRNSGERIKWYRKAAEHGHPVAQCNIAVLYQEGLNIPQDYGEAFRWFRKAAEAGDAPAQRGLAVLYAEGLGVPRNRIQAFAWFTLAAEQGDTNAAKGQRLLTRSMTDEQITEARRRASEFVAKKPTFLESVESRQQ